MPGNALATSPIIADPTEYLISIIVEFATCCRHANSFPCVNSDSLEAEENPNTQRNQLGLTGLAWLSSPAAEFQISAWSASLQRSLLQLQPLRAQKRALHSREPAG